MNGTKSITKAILIVPEGTKGAKYLTILKKYEGRIYVAHFNEDSAKYLIKQAIADPSQESYDMAKFVFGDLPEYVAPIPPYAEVAEEEGAEGEGAPSEEAGAEKPADSTE